MGGRMGGGRRGGAMGGRRASAGEGPRRMAQAPKTPQQRRRARRQDRRDARKAQRMAQVGKPGDSMQQPRSTTSGDAGWSDGGGFGLDDLFSQSDESKDYTSAEFNTDSLLEPYKKYADDPEEGWLTGLMRSGQRGYDLPKEVTLASAMNSPFRYYGGY